MKAKRILLAALALTLGACAGHYVTPAPGVALTNADTLSGAGDPLIVQGYAAQPASPFPARLAVVRVQDSGYAPHHSGQGRYRIVTTRDIENDDHFNAIAVQPLISGVAPVGRMLAPPSPDSLRELRAPAAMLQADMLLVYSVDTTFTVDGQILGPLSMISLGLLPNRKAHVTATVAAALIDVRTGFVYGTSEASATEMQRANLWSTEHAIDKARRLAETQAFDSFVAEFPTLWGGVLNTHAHSSARIARAEALAAPPQPSGDRYFHVRFED